MSDEAFDAVIAKFIAADEALRNLAERETALTAAADSFQTAGSKMQKATDDAAGALTSAEQTFHATATTAREIGEGTVEVLASLRTEIELLTQVLGQVSELEPDRLASDLSEIRRDLTDQAAELRELRRLESEARDASDRMKRTLEEIQTSQDNVEVALEERTAAIGESQTALARTLESQGRLLWALLAIAIVAAVLAGVAAF